MAATGTVRRKFALDTNVLIDLGEGRPFAQRFLATYRSSGLAVPPTVIQELVWMIDHNHTAAKFAIIALQNLRRWEIQPYDLISVGHGITEVNARELIASGLLPEDEFNDGLIVIETALGCVPSLVTSDFHLLKMNPGQLAAKLSEFDLPPVSIVAPKDLIR